MTEKKLEFETEAAQKLHNSVIHEKVPKKKKKTKKAKEPLLSRDKKEGYLSPDGQHVIEYLSAGKYPSFLSLDRRGSFAFLVFFFFFGTFS
jgi:hypothetical protein